MNQNEGKIVALDEDQLLAQKLESKNLEDSFHSAMSGKKPVYGNPDRKGSPLTARESDRTEKTPDGWPIIALYERVQLKGIWFIVTRMKPGSGNLGLKMMTTAQVREEKLPEYQR